jgi:hypothetical protein
VACAENKRGLALFVEHLLVNHTREGDIVRAEREPVVVGLELV